jgi:hypothetical protein
MQAGKFQRGRRYPGVTKATRREMPDIRALVRLKVRNVVAMLAERAIQANDVVGIRRPL